LSSDQQALHASATSVAAWDSLATVILAAAVEEEFGVQVEPEEIERLDSFESYLNRLVDGSLASIELVNPIARAV
jgi:acyl carrier protein